MSYWRSSVASPVGPINKKEDEDLSQGAWVVMPPRSSTVNCFGGNHDTQGRASHDRRDLRRPGTRACMYKC